MLYMINKRAQALVEFVLLLPIILILLFSMIDVFNLALQKNDLENELSNQVSLLEKDKITLNQLKNYFEKDNITIKTEKDDNYLNIGIRKEVDWISPMTKLILPKFSINSKRVVVLE